MDAMLNSGALRSLFESNPDSIVVYDPDGFLIDANSAAIEMSGYTLDELRGQHVTVHAAPAHRERVAVASRSALSGNTDHFETTIKRRNGEIVPLECFIFPSFDSEGAVACIFVIARDLVALKSAERSLGQNQERFRSLFEFHPDSIMALKSSAVISRVNVALESTTGFFNEKLVGKRWTDIIAPESHETASAAFAEAMHGETSEFDCLFLDRLGNRIDMQVKLVPLLIGAHIEGAYAIAKNMTAQRAAEQAIFEQSERIRQLYMVTAGGGSADSQIDRTLELACDALGFEWGYVTQIEGDTLTILNVVGPAHSVFKGSVFPRELVISRNLNDNKDAIYHPNIAGDAGASETTKRLALPWKSYFGIQLRVGGKQFGSIVFADRTARPGPLLDSDRDLAHLIAVFISAALERSEHEKRVEQLAFHDSLTGLPNRVLFDDRINQTIATARRYDRGFAVMFLDLDKFKRINDDLGHPAGDLLLRLVAERLRNTLRESDTVARFGGDEFVVLQPIVNGPGDSSDMARKIVNAMQVPFDLNGTAKTVHASIGISLFPQDGDSPEVLMANADKALYRAKRAGRNRWTFFNEEEQLRAWPTPPRRAS